MFNTYWRSYPWPIQLLQFIILIAVMFSFFFLGIAQFLLHMTGFSATDLGNISVESSRQLINVALWSQFLGQIGIFLLPALLFAYFSHPEPRKYLGLTKPGKNIHWILAVVLMLSAFPVFHAIAEFFSQFELGESAKLQQEENDRIMGAYLQMKSPVQLIFTFLVLAIIPGIGEELFFRGVIMRFAAKKSPNIIFPMLLSSIMFAMLHTNVYALVSIFLAGMLLATIYYLTGSLWCSMLCHMLFNGTQVLLSYLATQYKAIEQFVNEETVPLSWTIAGVIVFAVSFYLLWKNRTPLPRGWADDYSKEELLAAEE